MNRPLLLVSAAFFIILLHTGVVYAGCCFSSDPSGAGCVEASSAGDCEEEATYVNTDCQDLSQCNTVCCCAKEDAVIGPPYGGPDAWNNAEGNVQLMQRVVCEESDEFGLSYYNARVLPSGKSCNEVCGSEGGGGGETKYIKVTGTVKDSDGPKDNAVIFLPTPTGGYYTTTDSNGYFEVENVPDGLKGYLHVIATDCVPFSTDLTTFTDSGSGTLSLGELEIDCSSQSCTPNIPEISAALVSGKPEVRLSLSVDDNCNSLIVYKVKREKIEDGKPAGSCIMEFDPSPSGEYFDNNRQGCPQVDPNTEYRYSVVGVFSNIGQAPNNWDDANSVDITTGDSECMNEETQKQWCDNSGTPAKVVECDSQNKVQEVETCDDNQMCIVKGSGDDARANCYNSLSCDACNGAFGILGKIRSLVFGVLKGGTTVDCDSESIKNMCFDDRTSTVFDGKRSCSEVARCEDYLSESSCSENNCGIPHECSWVEIPSLGELGVGFCRSTDLPAACGECDERFGTCNKELCEAIGHNDQGVSDCYWESSDNGYSYSDQGIELPRCINKEEVSCMVYDTESDCGNQKPEVDVSYGTQDGKLMWPGIAGTNQITTKSNDLYGLGVCEWADGHCFKNSDMFLSSGEPLDDCDDYDDMLIWSKYGVACYKDTTPPVTTLSVPSEMLGLHQLLQSGVSVTDDTFDESDIKTLFCYDLKGSSAHCYPDMTLNEMVNKLDEELEKDQPKEFTIRYFSYDGAKNLEEVKSKDLTIVDMGVPLISDVSIR